MEQIQKLVSKSFIADAEKMYDFFTMTKSEFLEFYSYLKEDEYDATSRYVNWIVSADNNQKERE